MKRNRKPMAGFVPGHGIARQDRDAAHVPGLTEDGLATLRPSHGASRTPP